MFAAFKNAFKNKYQYKPKFINIFAAVCLMLNFAFLATAPLNAALPKFMGGSGLGISGQKANIDNNYPTFWDNLMKQQSSYNLYQGLVEMGQSKYKEAAQTFAKAVVKDPNQPYPHVFLGIALYWQGQVDPAMAEYRAALALDPKNEEANQLLGIAYAWKGDIKAALESFKIAIEINPNRPDTQMNIGSTYAALGQLDEALFHFRRAVALDKNHPLYQYQLGSLYEMLGRDNNAEDAFKKALRHYPNYEEAMLALGVLYEKMGKDTPAEINYKKALRLKPGDSVARLRLANLLAQTNRKDDAMEILAQAFLISPLSDEGLSLSLAYTGGNGGASSSGKSGTSGNKAANNSATSAQNPDKNPAKNPQLEQFKRRLAKIPADSQINMSMEISFEPKLKPSAIEENKANEGAKVKASALENAMEQKAVAEATSTFNRSFVLAPATDEARKEQLGKVFDGLNNMLKTAGEKYNIKMMLHAGTPVKQTNVLGGSSDGLGGSNPTSSMGKNSKAGYNPYMVGNDMGLWVAGKGWLKYIEEALPEIIARLATGDARDYMIAGLAYMALGQGSDALESFNKALNLAPKLENADDAKEIAQLATLGLGTAYIISGNEPAALEEYKKVLAINPENKIALTNIEILSAGEEE
ncbi:MAG: tetratricopeptide repeat protein [Elusimicrobiota bacterium]|jgi:tetratricopeptide (TPR) repeat protein|nr:tetratricopeptide repeat protein [Elusimicrobiota bacterium]